MTIPPEFETVEVHLVKRPFAEAVRRILEMPADSHDDAVLTQISLLRVLVKRMLDEEDTRG